MLKRKGDTKRWRLTRGQLMMYRQCLDPFDWSGNLQLDMAPAFAGTGGVTGPNVRDYFKSEEGRKIFHRVKPMTTDAARWRAVRLHELVSFVLHYNEAMLSGRYSSKTILNFDEIGLGTRAETKQAPKVVTQLLADKEANQPATRTTGTVTQSATLMVTIAASGVSLPGWIVDRPFARVQDLDFATHMYGCKVIHGVKSSSVTKEIMETHLPQHLQDYRERIGMPNAPLLIVCDGHSSRYSLKLILKLREMGVEMLLFPAHSTHIFQPVDTGYARTVKSKPLGSLQHRVRGALKHTKAEYMSVDAVLRTRLPLHHRASEPRNMAKIWEDVGLFPFTPERLDNRRQAPPNVRAFLDDVATYGGKTNTSMRAFLKGRGGALEHTKREGPFLNRMFGGGYLTSDAAVTVLKASEANASKRRIAKGTDMATMRAQEAPHVMSQEVVDAYNVAMEHAAVSGTDGGGTEPAKAVAAVHAMQKRKAHTCKRCQGPMKGHKRGKPCPPQP